MIQNRYKFLLLFLVVGFISICLLTYLTPPFFSDEIEAVVIGPLPGEYGYELKIIRTAKGVPLNVNTIEKKTPNMITTLNYLDKHYPQLKRVGISVGWFTNTIQAEKIKIVPKVTSRVKAKWRVGDYSRKTAPIMRKDTEREPIWNGTPTDQSVVELAKLFHDRGIEVTIYPYIFVDLPKQPWRGLIYARTTRGVDNFFKEYDKFILHYANLEYGGVELKSVIKGFLIGSELEALLRFKDHSNQFNAVDKMIELAAKTREVLGDDVEISYAANWSEYHHTDDGWHHLDKLWADKNIDYIGIDAYFPLTSHLKKNKKYSIDEIQAGWSKGEFYDYDDDERGHITPLQKEEAIKNLGYWWNSPHKNPDDTLTLWKPRMKPIVFSEVGFTSLRSTTNKPYFYVDDNTKGVNIYEPVSPIYQVNALKATFNFLRDLEKDPYTRGMIRNVFWYNIDPKPDNYDRLYDYELKVSDVEQSNGGLKSTKKKRVFEILSDDPGNKK